MYELKCLIWKQCDTKLCMSVSVCTYECMNVGTCVCACVNSVKNTEISIGL